MDKLEWMILAYVTKHPGAAEGSIARGVGMPEMSLFDTLCRLVKMGYLKKHGFSYYKIR